jgi:hypothetical protein
MVEAAAIGELEPAQQQHIRHPAVNLVGDDSAGGAGLEWKQVHVWLDMKAETTWPIANPSQACKRANTMYRRLTGGVQGAWASFTALRTLNISGNQLTSLSTQRNAQQSQATCSQPWLGWQQLVQLDVSHNDLKGTLPSCWSRLSNLLTLCVILLCWWGFGVLYSLLQLVTACCSKA